MTPAPAVVVVFLDVVDMVTLMQLMLVVAAVALLFRATVVVFVQVI
jgi:hypothetical protein